MLFSERKGYKQVKVELQRETISNTLLNSLWNVLYIHIFAHPYYDFNGLYLEPIALRELYNKYWVDLFKEPIDTKPFHDEKSLAYIRDKFFNSTWFEVFDFIEFTIQYFNDPAIFDIIKSFNNVFESEASPYRIINKEIIEITDKTEITSIEEALEGTSHYNNIHKHLDSALTLLSDRSSPDYRNSIKESISAVEAMVKKVTNNDKATLGDALNIIKKDDSIHKAFSSAMNNLYGYTNDADGIRHSLLKEDNLTFVDAKYMLVICTAFINYLLGKMAQK